jgi:hypothetical protein
MWDVSIFITILRTANSNENWLLFKETFREITEILKKFATIPVHCDNTRKPTVNQEDPKWIQKPYKRNRRKAMRIILGEDSRRRGINKEITENHFRQIAASKRCDVTIYDDVEVPEERNSIPTSKDISRRGN